MIDGQLFRSFGKPVMIAIPPEIDLGMLVLKLTQGLVSAPAGNLLNQASLRAVS